MTTNSQRQARLKKSIQASNETSRVSWQQYQAIHGAMSLSTHIYISSPTQGFPVLVRSHNDSKVRCRMLQTGDEFTVGMEEYKQHRGRDFVLDPALEKSDLATFKKHARWFRDAYEAVGMSLPVSPELETRN